MKGEILSITTTQTLAKLERENRKLNKIVENYVKAYDNLVNSVKEIQKEITDRKIKLNSYISTNRYRLLASDYNKKFGQLEELKLIEKIIKEVQL